MMPFLGGLESTANGALILSMGAAIIYALVFDARPTLLRSVLKTLAVGTLAFLAYQEGGPLLLVVALALSAMGDAFLSRDGEKPFLAGLASFLAAHIAYVVLFLTHGGGIWALTEGWRTSAAGLIGAFTMIMLSLLIRRVKPAMRLPILAYGLAIAAMAIAALTVPGMWVIGGALLFMASDGLLAVGRFMVSGISPHRDWMRHAVWATYYVAQLAITLGFLLA